MTTTSTNGSRIASRLFGWLPNLSGAGKTVADVLPVRLSQQTLSGTRSAPVTLAGFDQALVWVTVALLMFGLVMVYSASIAMPDNPKFARYAHTHFLFRHALSLVVAFLVALLAFQVPVATWQKLAPWFFVVSLVLLILVLVPFIGKGVNGARRWITLGFMNFQPSELDSAGDYRLSALGVGQVCRAAVRR
jgi:cell division protein FtsW